MENPVVGSDRAACTITCEMPDGKRLISNTIYELTGGKIARQGKYEREQRQQRQRTKVSTVG